MLICFEMNTFAEMKPFLFLFLVYMVTSATPNCRKELEETVCENFELSSELILDSGTNKLTIKNAKGPINRKPFSKLDEVTEIEITGSEITDIEFGALCSTPNLESLTIVNNKKFPKITHYWTLQGCQHVKKINLTGPGVQIGSEAFKNLSNLQSLALNNTDITNFDGLFKGLESLKSLTVTYSGFRFIKEDTFRGLENLQFLHLQNNNIEKIDPNAFKKLSKLKILNLADNKLENLTWQEFDGLKGLRILFMERNNISTVDVDKLVTSVPNLETIVLSYEPLTLESRKKIEEILSRSIKFIHIGESSQFE